MPFVFSDICGHEYENKTRMLYVYEWFLFDEGYASLEWTISRTSQWYNLSFVLLLDWSSMNQGIQIHINMCLKILWSNFLCLCMVSQISITCYSYWVKYSNKNNKKKCGMTDKEMQMFTFFLLLINFTKINSIM